MVPVKPLTVLECSMSTFRPPSPLSDWTCRFVIVCLQFGKTSMFLWMLCEGIHLNSVLTVSVFKRHWKMYHFYLLGWGEWGWPCLVVESMAFVSISYSICSHTQLECRDAHETTVQQVTSVAKDGDPSNEFESVNRCFYHYMHLNYYWIIEGPRYIVMMVSGLSLSSSLNGISFLFTLVSRSMSFSYWILFEFSWWKSEKVQNIKYAKSK